MAGGRESGRRGAHWEEGAPGGRSRLELSQQVGPGLSALGRSSAVTVPEVGKDWQTPRNWGLGGVRAEVMGRAGGWVEWGGERLGSH